ncbi:plasma-membrane choline transporter-domain-containing protein [Cladochytrium replicatum]|nr:plasma-membrane choline transporter-domain-containing protein [Cladochytrium replicatum]
MDSTNLTVGVADDGNERIPFNLHNTDDAHPVALQFPSQDPSPLQSHSYHLNVDDPFPSNSDQFINDNHHDTDSDAGSFDSAELGGWVRIAGSALADGVGSMFGSLAFGRWRNNNNNNDNSRDSTDDVPEDAPLLSPILPPEDPDAAEPAGTYVEPSVRNYKDVPFLILFVVSSTIMWMAGASYVYHAEPPIVTDPGLPKSIYETVKGAGSLILLSATVAVVCGALWLLALSVFVRPVVWMSIVAIPTLALSMVALLIGNAAVGKANDASWLNLQYDWVIGISVSCAIIGLTVTNWILTRRHKIEQSIRVIELSCEILWMNPSIVGLSAIMFLAQSGFTLVWMIMFSSLFMMTDVHWTELGVNNWVVAFFVLMYLWTSSILANLEKTTIAGVVGKWYFSGDHGTRRTSSSDTVEHFKSAASKSFGSIAFGSLILSSIQLLQLIVTLLRKQTRKNRTRRFILSFVDSVLLLLHTLLSQLNAYAVVWVGLTGDALLASARTCARLFRRNLALVVIQSTITQLVLSFGIGAVSLVSSATVFLVWSRQMQSPYAYVVGLLGGAIPYYALHILSQVLQNTIDATIMAYMIDLDRRERAFDKAHVVFAAA